LKVIYYAVVIAVILFFLLRIMAKNSTLQDSFPQGTSPGITDGKLAPCKSSPNGVSSHSDPSDSIHYAKVILIPESIPDPKQRLIELLNRMPQAKIIEEYDNYVRAEFRSKWMQYVDDVEFIIDHENRHLHFRSASRVGYSDMGVNRKRIEEIRSSFSMP
jgi:uncharacterized protein (DUF1499 family)